MILKHCLVQRQTIGIKLQWDGFTRFGPHGNLAPQVLSVCKQIFNEGVSLLYTENVLRVYKCNCYYGEDLSDPFSLPPLPMSFWRISKLEVSIDEIGSDSTDQLDLDGYDRYGCSQPRIAVNCLRESDNIQWVNCKVKDSENIYPTLCR